MLAVADNKADQRTNVFEADKKGAIEMDGVIVRGNFNGAVKEVRVRNCDDNQSESSATNDKVKPCE